MIMEKEKLNILVVDDEPDMLDTILAILRLSELNVFGTTDSTEAEELVRKNGLLYAYES